MAQQRDDAERNVRLAHADLVGQVGDTMALQDVVQGDGPVELIPRPLRIVDFPVEVQ
ncbi:hypothetical protein [Micromonospora sp. NPDC049799]|uniref:hypothetical protein n=1 Tax=Micromonospora sp. NPDC049799 TaxID=3154741 RepID=UPI0033D29537